MELNGRPHRSIEFGNRTKSNVYFAESSIIEPIKQNPTQPTQSDSNFLDPFLESQQPLLKGIIRKTYICV